MSRARRQLEPRRLRDATTIAFTYDKLEKWIGEAGLYDYKARDYLPHLGLFAQTDPIGQADSANLYAYVLDDPVNLIDPLGLAPQTTEQTPLTGTRIIGGISPQLFGSLGGPGPSGGNSSGTAGGGGGAGTGVYGQVAITEWLSVPSGAISYTYAYSFFGDPGAAFQFASFGGNESDAELKARSSQYLRNAVLAALRNACKCQINSSNIIPLNWNFARVLDQNKLPNIFSSSVSIHSSSSSVDIGYGYELKYYSSEKAITITTSTWSYEHVLGVPSFLLGEPVNTINARGYCFYSRVC